VARLPVKVTCFPRLITQSSLSTGRRTNYTCATRGVNADVPPPAGSISPVPAGSPIAVRILNADTIAFETLEARLRIAVAEADGQIVGPAQFCAWTRV
jgi:hypothetical protein